jgi:hypothetical protein
MDNDAGHVAGGKLDSAVAPQLNGAVPRETLNRIYRIVEVSGRRPDEDGWAILQIYGEELSALERLADMLCGNEGRK